jgi:predicted phage-related endonuclease
VRVLDVVQGTPEWKAGRKAADGTASEASAMMGESKHMSRNDLLTEKKTGVAKEIDGFTQALFDKGHAMEAKARKFKEREFFEDLSPVTGTENIEGMLLLASFDGLSDEGTIWEHKMWNKTLAENVRNGVLEPHYYWQLEHQCLVADRDFAHFQTSDGTVENSEELIYQSQPQRRAKLIAGWRHFKKDLEDFEVAVRVETVAPRVIALPVVTSKVDGSMIISNIDAVVPIIQELAQ